MGWERLPARDFWAKLEGSNMRECESLLTIASIHIRHFSLFLFLFFESLSLTLSLYLPLSD